MSELDFKAAANKITPIDAELTIQDLAILAAEHGYAVVPVVATDEMVDYACSLHTPSKLIGSTGDECVHFGNRRRIWRTMIEAGRIK